MSYVYVTCIFTMECEYCCTMIHSKCTNKANFSQINQKWACKICQTSVEPRYLPFDKWIGDDSDKHCSDNNDCADNIPIISQIHNNCKSYTSDSLNEALSAIIDDKNKIKSLLSSFFLNIDGNNTNFDFLLAILKGITHKFSAIGLAETNTCPETAAPYIIPGYQSFYQNTRQDKSSGTGVALYLHESLNGTIVQNLSLCTTDIETVVVEVSNLKKPVYFGVVYRPHDANMETFYQKLEDIFNAVPKSGSYIMGDFNINLLGHVNLVPNLHDGVTWIRH